MQQFKSILTYGFALFAMFFGSGNLVFPIKIGQASGNYWLLGCLGLFITGIILPFLGLFVVKLHRGNYNSFFAEAGSIAKVILPLFTLSLLGSFGVVPRCVTVAYGGMSYIIPTISLEMFSGAFCIITFLMCLKDQYMIHIIGKWMSPLLLVILVILISLGITHANPLILNHISPTQAFYNGFLTGYQTMDLFAAFFFSSIIFTQIQKVLPPTAAAKDILRFSIKPCFFGVALLSLVYSGFVFLGAHFSDLIENVEPEFMLSVIAAHTLGNSGALFVAIAIMLSCLTTAVALNNIYARYLCNLLRLKEDRFIIVLASTTAISYVVSLYDFKGIATILGPALEISYPSIIALTILGMFSQGKRSYKVIIFYILLIIMIFKPW